MTAYAIAEIQVDDPSTYAAYKAQVAETLVPYDGHYLARGGTAELLEDSLSPDGPQPPGRVVVIAFPDMAKLNAWAESEAYAGPKAIRQSAARARILAVAGV